MYFRSDKLSEFCWYILATDQRGDKASTVIFYICLTFIMFSKFVIFDYGRATRFIYDSDDTDVLEDDSTRFIGRSNFVIVLNFKLLQTTE
jgi:hypothetical protein